MNATKKNNGWILCPSKTFPGKFYYFNVLNGETAWSLGDAEKNIIKRDGGIPKVTDNHHHPEPSSPPIADPVVTTTVKLSQQKFSLMKHPTPVFGQSVFPKALPTKPEDPSVIWTPIQIQVPIVIAPENRIQPKQVSQVLDNEKTPSKHKIDTLSVPMLELGKELYVNACTKPLCQRFVNYDQPVINFDKDNKIKDKGLFDKFYSSTPIKIPNQKNSTTFKTIGLNTDQMFQSKINLSFSDLKPKITKQKQLIKESVFNIELPSNTTEKVFELAHEKLKQVEPKVDSSKAGIAMASSGPVVNNFSDDLRNLLLAKKRKSLDFEVKSNIEETDSKKVKTIEQLTHPTKKVTFNFDYENISSIEYDGENETFEEKYVSTMQKLRDLAGPGLRNNEWCLIVDSEVLLEEFSFLDKLVQIDPKCKLVIPPSVITEVAEVSKGDGRGRARVTQARNIIRKLQNNHIIAQTADGEELKSPPNDAILKTCLEAINQNIHLILITNNEELQTTAKSYHIHCYNIQDIKNGLALKPKESGYKQMRITIHNDTNPKFTENGLAVHSFKKNMFGNESSNGNGELNSNFNSSTTVNKPMIPNSRISNEMSRTSNEISRTLNVNPNITNTSSRVSSEHSKYLVNKSILSNVFSGNYNHHSKNTIAKAFEKSMMMNTNENSKISNTNTLIATDHSTVDMTNTAPIIWITNSPNAYDNSKISNVYSRTSNVNSRISNVYSMTSNVNSRTSNENSKISNGNSTVFNTKALTTEWRCAASDITETTIDVDMQNLKIREKSPYKPLEKHTTTHRTEKKRNETVSFFFQNPTPKFDFQKFKLQNKPTASIFQNGREKSIETPKPIFETNKTKEPLNSVFEIKKDKSKFEIDVFEKPQRNGLTRNNTDIDLNRFYVKSKVMENRLIDRIDEWMCSFIQIMEEFLCSILQKLSRTVLKSMAPPWSMYEALQCTKTVYKDHAVIKRTVDEICSCLYEADCRMDKIKKNITPSEFMKAIGYGINLIQYLKKVQHSEELSDAEERLHIMIQHIEDPESDVEEPLVKTPVVSNTDDKEVRQNFVKNRSEIINYLKKHYPEWQSYENDNSKMKIVRTYGRDLNLLRLDKVAKSIEKNTKKLAEDYISKNNIDAIKKKDEVSMKNVDKLEKNIYIDFASKGVGNVATKNVDKGLKTDTELLERTKVVPNGASTKENVDKVATESTELKKAKMKLVQMKNDLKNADSKKVSKFTKTIQNNCVDSKIIEKSDNAKPKLQSKSIFDFIKPKDTKKHEETQNTDNNNLASKLKIDSGILAVKITVPNDYKEDRLQKNAEFDKDNKIIRKSPDDKSVNEKHCKDTKEFDKRKEISQANNPDKVKPENKIEKQKVSEELRNKNEKLAKTDGTNKENGPKIVRNVHIIEEFEKRFKSIENDYSEELDYTPIHSSDDETNSSNTNEQCFDSKEVNNNNNDIDNATKEYDLDNHKEMNKAEFKIVTNNKVGKIIKINCKINNDMKLETTNLKNDTNDIKTDTNNIKNDTNDMKTDTNYIKNDTNDIKKDTNDIKNDTNERKNDKDDMTNDSGFGNESPHIYSVVKSFSTELCRSLEFIQRFIDGCLQEFKDGKIKEDTKKMFRLKVFEANFLITKIMIRLNNLLQKESNGQNGDMSEKFSKNTDAVVKSIEQAQILNKVLNMLLTLTNEDGSLAELNSSMSLNLSS